MTFAASGNEGNYNMLDGLINNIGPACDDLTDGQTYGQRPSAKASGLRLCLQVVQTYGFVLLLASFHCVENNAGDYSIKHFPSHRA